MPCHAKSQHRMESTSAVPMGAPQQSIKNFKKNSGCRMCVWAGDRQAVVFVNGRQYQHQHQHQHQQERLGGGSEPGGLRLSAAHAIPFD
eukprot:CAMPEP_0206449512 /NCGR_PEP_ID=MMETSP0324_2-20121206/18135_1 /ASSEMBLY_ACC=CAM_ASM_000836 /TAXON_ID=2866 /ORGANISM="Crypthecodinium cohnii, Strain Seligo" /LENGTH=88 /DNA_ID=CAMNT_0053918907 /DNA_START=231 /DNA_END=494 /DNA_ORIENTATION=+